MEINTAQIKQLREATGAGVLDCRKALLETKGDFEKAVIYLREKGLAAAAKRADREARQGVLDLYSHGGGRVGVMVEVNCETDFVARTEEFRRFAHEVALQVAAANPRYVDVADVPAEALEAERAKARERARDEGKPENVWDRIAEGMLEKFYTEACLLRQPYVRDDKRTVGDLLKEAISTTKENILIRRFTRWEVGETAE
ncbi:MAG: translation elongation factor Ts [Chloroflexi bacterium RBG_16_64_43]|nr:MAG: translation elongation factor Ts [Chloroflexi bacterium RBG_16_64_43]